MDLRPASRPKLRAAWASLVLLVLCGATGCIGAVAGTIIDTVQHALQHPVHEYVFRGAYKFDNDGSQPWRELVDERGRDYGNALVGIAVSGGGSRSAYFLACVLDALRRVPAAPDEPARSLLDEIDYLSSVSGGSLAAAYYALKRPGGSDPAELDRFFARFRSEMRKDFEVRSIARTLFLFRWVPLVFTYYDRGRVMASTWDANFFDDATFADLPEPRPPHPSLILNATSYSSGHKFLFSRLPSSRFNEASLFRELRRHRFVTEGYDPAHQPVFAEGFDSIDSDIGEFELSRAVVASAGVPNLLGPVVLEDRTREDTLIALGDGGIYDNYGLETLVQLFARILEERPGLQARILVVDGSGYFPVERDVIDYSVAGYADRTAMIAWLRASDYAEALFDTLPGIRFEVLSLYHRGGGRFEKERHGVQQAVGAVFDPVVGFFGDLNQAARAIGTRFMLSDADAAIIEAQAGGVVESVLGPPRASEFPRRAGARAASEASP